MRELNYYMPRTTVVKAHVRVRGRSLAETSMERRQHFDEFAGQRSGRSVGEGQRRASKRKPPVKPITGGTCKKRVVKDAQQKFTALAKEKNLTVSQILIGKTILSYMRTRNNSNIPIEDVATQVAAEIRKKHGKKDANGRKVFWYCPRRTLAGHSVFSRLFDRLVKSKILVIEGRNPRTKIVLGKDALKRAARLSGLSPDRLRLATGLVAFYSKEANQSVGKTNMARYFGKRFKGQLFELEFRELGSESVKKFYKDHLRGVCVEEEGHTGRDSKKRRITQTLPVLVTKSYAELRKDPVNSPYDVRPVKGAVKAVDKIRYRESSRDLARAVVRVLGNGGVITKEELARGVARSMAKKGVVPKLRGKDLTVDMVWDTYKGLLKRHILA